VASLFFSQQFNKGSSLYVSASHTSGTQKDNRITAYWYKPLDNNRSVSSSVERTNAGKSIGVDLVQSQPTLGWGARAQLRGGDTDRAAVQVGYSNTKFAWDAGVDYYHATQSDTAYYTGMRGSVVWMNGLHPSRQIIDSFAVVDTKTANIPVYLENNLVGKTNSKGVLLVPYLQAYQRNKISVDGSHLPVDYKIPTTSQWIVPRQNQGVNVLFDVKPVSSITATIVDANNTPLPLGAVLEHNGETVMVGYDGMVYIEQPSGIWQEQKSQCRVEIPTVSGYNTLGVLVCK
jgi:outer membrane usher protein